MITQEKAKTATEKTRDSEKISTKSVAKVKRPITLRRRLLISILPAALIPLIIATGIEYNASQEHAVEDALAKLQNDSLLASKEMGIFIEESFKTHTLIKDNPLVIEVMRSGAELAEAQGLLQQPIAAVEQQFATNKLLQSDATLNSFLQQIVSDTEVAEIIITERNGFNVAYSNTTTDFVQRDEGWWQTAKQEERSIDSAEFDNSANAEVFPLSQAIFDPETGEFLGVIQVSVAINEADKNLATYLSSGLRETETVQLINTDSGEVEETITNEGSQREVRGIVGGEAILSVTRTLGAIAKNSSNLDRIRQTIETQSGFSVINLKQEEIASEIYTLAEVRYQDKVYAFTTVPKLDLVAVSSIDSTVVAAEGQNFLLTFVLTSLIAGAISLGLIVFLARQISQPLTNLSATTKEVAQGNLDIKAKPEGTLESQVLADNFNQLVMRVKELLQEQKNIAEQQRQEKEQLEAAIYTLIEEVADATEGDLTVRASLSSVEMSTVADLFNAIIDSLREIAIETKQSTSKVGSVLKQNEKEVLSLADLAIDEAKETRNSLVSVEQMSASIQAVATNANLTEQIANDTYSSIIASSSNMDLTVDSILELRNTVGETTKKMKRLGESSQKISQVVSFIEEIALKTNVLAINASVEARRAGEYGEGFTIVAEQVGALAEQSATATQKIASIVTAIQTETQEVNQALELGTAQVVDTTRLVESTKASLSEVLDKAQKIDRLMSLISQNTVSQADTAQSFTDLMRKIVHLSETISASSRAVARSMVETVRVAEKLESAVARFKVAESP